MILINNYILIRMTIINNYILTRMTKMKESIETLSERLMLMYIKLTI